MLRKFTKGQDLIRPGATRFATAYLTLGCLSNCKITLMSMFTSVQWRSSRYSKSEEGRQIQNCVLDSNFWHDVSECIKAAFPLIKVLRLVDSDEIPAMGFIYKAMQEAKEKIKVNFGNVQKRPLHAFAYWLNPHYHYITDYKQDKNIKYGMYDCLTRMVPDEVERDKIDLQLNIFSEAKGLFGIEAAKKARDKKTPARWWDSYGDECPELQNLAIRVLSLTCSSSGCERNWSAFEMCNTKTKWNRRR
ncbi:SCAN domain-containing protein [Salix suchowensis]|nr:SCAN domain-containing protein [Salix suchowensis]